MLLDATDCLGDCGGVDPAPPLAFFGLVHLCAKCPFSPQLKHTISLASLASLDELELALPLALALGLPEFLPAPFLLEFLLETDPASLSLELPPGLRDQSFFPFELPFRFFTNVGVPPDSRIWAA